MIDQYLKPWLIEINANPSLRIDYEVEESPGVYNKLPSDIDLFVK